MSFEIKLLLFILLVCFLPIGLSVYSSNSRYIPKNIEVICDQGVISYKESIPVVINRNYLSCKGL